MANKSVGVTRNDAETVSPALHPDGFTRWPGLREIWPVSRETVRTRERAGRFPKHVQLGSTRSIGWKNSELLRWLADPNGYRAPEIG